MSKLVEVHERAMHHVMTPSTTSALPMSKPFLSFSPSSRPLSPTHTRLIEVPPLSRSVKIITGPFRQADDSVKPAVLHRFPLPSEARFPAPQTSTALLSRPPKAKFGFCAASTLFHAKILGLWRSRFWSHAFDAAHSCNHVRKAEMPCLAL